MARFQVNEPIRSQRPVIVVDPGLAPGVHRFELVVTDSRGRRSAPAVVAVNIVRR